ncbi:hypothetical protein [Spirosoma foliorum]|uniref:Capsid protein n=1 Tax=Spirosoma foliorum TaxID=2710596 RepID=A0A7G5H5I5_9BACT|nr:hypothetical protein [Spirosoma foliorum]QMW06377.1 hypothetical protein H3H32_16540 [Spirosoma foliorum]
MSLTALTLPEMILGVDTGEFGAYEKRMSHYGALNAFVNNTTKLFGADALAKIRKQPFTRTIKIPLLNKYSATVLTVRSCTISPPSISPTLKSLTRIHMAVDMGVVPDDFEDNYTTPQQALRHQYIMARKEILRQLDTVAAATLDTNKDTVINSWDANHPLYTRSAGGSYQLPASKPEDFYINMTTIMDEMDVSGPYFDIASTIAKADKLRLQYPGGGSALDTRSLMGEAGIQEFETSNRIARGTNRTVHYVGPMGSIGVVNIIDKAYRNAPEIGSAADIAQWEKAGNMSDINLWGRMSDDLFEGWEWGVLQRVDCVDEKIAYSTKLSADFCFATDFTSDNTTPIKRFEMVQSPI